MENRVNENNYPENLEYVQEAQDEFSNSASVFANVGQGLTGSHRDIMMQYWQETINNIEREDQDFKNHQLPLARIKKVMKTDEDVKMISAEAPILFAKGCDIFITELTMRAWIHAEENKRRTLQRSDIAAALQKSDMFDFLIDIVPREEEKTRKSSSARRNSFHHQHTAPIQYSHQQMFQQTNQENQENQANVQHQMSVPGGQIGLPHQQPLDSLSPGGSSHFGTQQLQGNEPLTMGADDVNTVNGHIDSNIHGKNNVPIGINGEYEGYDQNQNYLQYASELNGVYNGY